MKRGHFDAMLPQRAQNRIHFLSDQYEVAGDSGFSTAGGLKVDRFRRAHRGGDRHAAFSDRLNALDANLINAAADLAFTAKRGVNSGGIQVDLWGRRGWRRLSGWHPAR